MVVFSTGYVLSDQGMYSYYHFKKALGSSHFVHSCVYQHCDSPPTICPYLDFQMRSVFVHLVDFVSAQQDLLFL